MSESRTSRRDRPQQQNTGAEFHIDRLQKMTIKELQEIARNEKVENYRGLKKQELVWPTGIRKVEGYVYL